MIMRFVGWIIRVFVGFYNWIFEKPNAETLRRRKICKTCEYKKHGQCTICYCFIKPKTASPKEKCLMNKW